MALQIRRWMFFLSLLVLGVFNTLSLLGFGTSLERNNAGRAGDVSHDQTNRSGMFPNAVINVNTIDNTIGEPDPHSSSFIDEVDQVEETNVDSDSINKGDETIPQEASIDIDQTSDWQNDFVERICAPIVPSKGRPFVRVAVAYFDSSPAVVEQFEMEIRWWYRSWIEILRLQPANTRTDLFIGCEDPAESVLLQELGCTSTPRVSVNEPSRCIALPYQPLKHRPTEPQSEYMHWEDMEWTKIVAEANYYYTDSVQVILDLGEHLNIYDFLYRCDTDLFLTPSFANLIPPDNCTLYSSVGQYVTEHTRFRLERIADYLDLRLSDSSELTQPGSGFYGSPEVISRIVEIQLETMQWIAMHEFTLGDFKNWEDVRGWPDWHFGVLLLYGTYLGVHDTVVRYQLEVGPSRFDCPAESSNSIDDCYSLHTFHNYDWFSKFMMSNHTYRDIELATLNMSKQNDYCGFLALQANYALSTKDLRHLSLYYGVPRDQRTQPEPTMSLTPMPTPAPTPEPVDEALVDDNEQPSEFTTVVNITITE